MDARTLAAAVLTDVLATRRSLGAALAGRLAGTPARDHALVQEMCYGVMRWQPRLAALIRALLHKPLKTGNDDIYSLILLGLYQLIYMRMPPHAAISETVAGTRRLNKPWASGLVNGILREFQRNGPALLAEVDRDPVARTAHPDWFLTRLQSAWPDDWQAIVEANNRRPPLTLRVNRLRVTRADYLTRLAAAGHPARPADYTTDGIILEKPVDVTRLPGFADGDVSVQDAAAQLAAPLLDMRPGDRVLDACAAPGGKTAHVLEVQPRLAELIAVDNDRARAERISRNLQRLNLRAQITVADAARPDDWWDGRPFDRILLDAPCSATGVIRRHPDIKYLRRPTDIAPLVDTQARLLTALWPLLNSGGMLLYVTCSVLPDENAARMALFTKSQPEAIIRPLTDSWGRACEMGRQTLPGENDMDGFYYACLSKR